MSTTPQADFFLPPALVEEQIVKLLSQAAAGRDALERTPARQRTAEERAMLEAARRDVAAYAHALEYWRQGLYPSCLDGIWSIDSRSERGCVKHHIWRHFETTIGQYRWYCDCKASHRGYTFHVHTAIMTAIEVALDIADTLASDAELGAPAPSDTYEAYEPESDIDPEPFPTEAPAQLGRRLALARDVARRFNEELFAA